MKSLRILLTIIMLCFATQLFSVIPPKILDAMKVGNAVELAKYFNSSVEVAILETESVYSRQQAEQVVKVYFLGKEQSGTPLIHQLRIEEE